MTNRQLRGFGGVGTAMGIGLCPRPFALGPLPFGLRPLPFGLCPLGRTKSVVSRQSVVSQRVFEQFFRSDTNN